MVRCFLSVACCAALAADSLIQLRQLENEGRIFAMRDLLKADNGRAQGAALYRAIANSRFGRETQGISQLRAFLATNPPPDQERKARLELSWALTRLSGYEKAAVEMASALRVVTGEGGREDLANVQTLLESLVGVPPQAVEFGRLAPVQARRNELGLWSVPVEVNSRRGEWIFDTGANFSTVSESEARRLGLSIRDVRGGYARKIDGTPSPARAAVAKDLRLGPARLSNVVFLVLPDRELHVPALRYQISGIIGMPVLRALECFELSSKGILTLDCRGRQSQGAPNLFFDGLNAIAQVEHLGRGVQMMLDTGAVASLLYPSIRGALAQWEINQLAGAQNVGPATLLPSIQLDIQRRAVFLQRIPLMKQAPHRSACRDGILGIDALRGGFRVDFRGMQLELQ